MPLKKKRRFTCVDVTKQTNPCEKTHRNDVFFPWSFNPPFLRRKKLKLLSKVDLRSRGRDYRLDPTAQPNGAEEYETNHETRGLFASQGAGTWKGGEKVWAFVVSKKDKVYFVVTERRK